MRDRFVTWGTLDDSKRLFTFELDADEAQIIRRVIPAAASTEELLQTIINAWNNLTTMPYPEGTSSERIPLQASGTIVPDGADVDDKVRIASAEREWPFDIVSAQLRRQFRAEFEELHDVVGNLTAFDEGIFERLKGVWNKVQSELTNKVIRYEHTHDLRKLSDELFVKMKELRRGKEKAVRSKSKEIKKDFRELLAGAQKRLEKKENLRGLFNDLKKIQEATNKAALSRDDRNSLRKSIDELFKATKSEINATGEDAGILTEQRVRLEKRLNGLQSAVKRMKHSVNRDNQDVFYENRRIQQAGNQLAEQLGAAKMTMLKERAASKQLKLDDMLATEADLQKRLDKVKKREEKALNKRQEKKAENTVAVASSDGNTPPAKTRKRGRNRPIVTNKMVKDAAAILGMDWGA
ncbi:MAG: hypothetical protein AB8F78_06860 [Saprospiraceae bacterium]